MSRFANSLKFTPICNATGCQCVDDRSFAPVCDKDNELNYFSACTAGCKNATKENGSFVYSDCQCGSDGRKLIILRNLNALALYCFF